MKRSIAKKPLTYTISMSIVATGPYHGTIIAISHFRMVVNATTPQTNNSTSQCLKNAVMKTSSTDYGEVKLFVHAFVEWYKLGLS